jgi:hypothetical protein
MCVFHFLRQMSQYNDSWQLVQCANLEQALLAAENTCFDVIIIDEMPFDAFGPATKTASEAISAIRLNEKHKQSTNEQADQINKVAKIVWLYGYTTFSIPTGADSVWKKPLNKDTVQADIERALE